MHFLSVCSGIEAASVAWRPLGWQAIAFSEIEPFPSAVLAHHYPDTPNWGDMTRYKEWPDANVDLLCGGTPCQSFSVAGLRKGLDDPRGNLMLTFGAIAGRYRPRWLVWENVPGVLSSNGGRDFGAFLGMLGQLGYGFAYRVLDAQFFGVPQRRRRVFVVGCLGDWRSAAAVLFERHSLSGHPAPRRKTRQSVAGTLAGGARTRGGFSYDDVPQVGIDYTNGLIQGDIAGTLDAGQDRGNRGQGVLVANTLLGKPNSSHAADQETYVAQAFGGNNTAGPIDISTALNACASASASGRMDFDSETFIAHSLRGEGFDASEDGAGRGTPIVPVPFDTTQITSKANRSNPRPGDPCHPLAAGAHPPAIAFDCKSSGQNGFGIGVEVAGTQRAMAHRGSHSNGGGHQAVAYAIQAGALRENPTSGPDGVGVQSDHAYTLEARAEVQAVAIALRGREGGATAEMGDEVGHALRASSGGGDKPHVMLNTQVRRLTPEECEALQAFPRNYTRIPWRNKPADQCPDGPRYKALGNSWCVTNVRWIGERIDMVDKLLAGLDGE